LFPHRRFTFQLARYQRGHFIEKHDDKAYVKLDDPDEDRMVSYTRDVAIIFYFNKNWTSDDGGILVDHKRTREHKPVFNSMVAFRVPRLHEVTPVKSDRNRFSLFGWFLSNEDYVTSKSKRSTRHEDVAELEDADATSPNKRHKGKKSNITSD
jgi:Rps23 Pro-64 3,4-dihydroxylase Tpa1-like proline 4-hydroxylase